MNSIKAFLEETKPNGEYYLLVAGAAVIALVGILIDSIPTIIAAMIVAPLIQPILVAAYGAVSGRGRHALHAIWSFIISIVIVFVIAAIGVRLLSSIAVPTEDRVFISFVPQPLAAFLVAFVSGIFATIGIYSKRIESVMIGIGIAVSLMVPLVATGIGLGIGWFDLVVRASEIFGLNVLGVFLGSAVMFLFITWGIFGLKRRAEE